MFIRAHARRLAATARLAVHGPPLLRLLRLLRRGEFAGSEYADLCLQLGLSERAASALGQAPAAPSRPSLTLRLAALRGEVGEALGQARALAARLPDATVSQREIEAVVSCIAPLAPEVALALIRASGRPNPAEPALRLRLGDVDAARRDLDRDGARLGPQRWLLWANLQDQPGRQLEGLNRYLAAHGLSAARLRDPARPLAVGNLDAGGLPSRRASGRAALISIVMTCHDCAPYVEASIRSVLEQTYRRLELIVVDDASRDGTWRSLQSAAAADPRVRAVRLERNVGTYAAKNVGLLLAGGELLAFQDADDWSCPERLAQCVALLQQRPWLQAVTCEYVRLQDDGRFWSSLVWPLQRRTPNSVVFRRRVFERIGFFDEHRFGSDSEYVARLLVAFGPRSLHRLGRPLIVAARRENSLMTSASTGLDALGRSRARAEFQQQWTEALLSRGLAGESLRREAQQGTLALIAESAGSR